MCLRNLKSVALHVPEIRGVANPNLEEGEAIGVGDGTVQKSIGDFI